MSTLSLVVLIVILAIAFVLAVIVFIKVRRRQWFSGFRLDSKNRAGSPHDRDE